MENTNKDYSHIKGWGIDADPKNDPTYPMKDRNGLDHEGYSWERPTQQPIEMEVLHSIERPSVSAVFGTSAPPEGLSGRIREMAFQYSENRYRHWLPLLLADRVNVVEGLIDDLRRGRIPNIFAERGMRAEWQYNRAGLLRKLAVSAALSYAAYRLLFGRKSKRQE